MRTHDRLRGKMRERGITVREIADYIGISETSMIHKLQGKTQFKAYEMQTICERLDIPADEVANYFFA